MKNVALFVGNDIFSGWCAGSIAALKGECAFTVYFPRESAGRTQEPAVRRPGCMSAKC